MSFGVSSKRLKLSTFKLNALLSMAQAISSDMKTEDLLERFRIILNNDLEIDRVAFYKFEKTWELILATNCSADLTNQIDVERDLSSITDIAFISSSHERTLHAFDAVIPVVQNNAPLAYVLIADTKEEAKGVSATIKHLNFVQTLSIIIFVAIENLRLFHKTLEQEAMKKELELASQMQNLLVPDNDSIPQTKEVKIHAFYHPHSEVGGDFYDVIELGKDEVGFCIADVSGKGMAAALLMSNFQANLRALFTHDITLTGLVEKLNERIMSTAKGERFITIFIGRYNRTRRQLEYVNAGHNPPVLYSMASNHISLLNEGCVGLGMVEDIPFISVGSIRISEKSKLLCYTDGLVEYINNNKVELSTKIIEQNLSNNDSISKNVQDIFKARKDKEQFEGFGIFDDISMLGFEFS